MSLQDLVKLSAGERREGLVNFHRQSADDLGYRGEQKVIYDGMKKLSKQLSSLQGIFKDKFPFDKESVQRVRMAMARIFEGHEDAWKEHIEEYKAISEEMRQIPRNATNAPEVLERSRQRSVQIDRICKSQLLRRGFNEKEGFEKYEEKIIAHIKINHLGHWLFEQEKETAKEILKRLEWTAPSRVELDENGQWIEYERDDWKTAPLTSSSMQRYREFLERVHDRTREQVQFIQACARDVASLWEMTTNLGVGVFEHVIRAANRNGGGDVARLKMYQGAGGRAEFGGDVRSGWASNVLTNYVVRVKSVGRYYKSYQVVLRSDEFENACKFLNDNSKLLSTLFLAGYYSHTVVLKIFL